MTEIDRSNPLLQQLAEQAKPCHTATGRPVWWMYPERTEIVEDDMRLHLSRVRRYMGAVDCTDLTHLMICGLLAEEHGPEVKKYACAHDLVEAYLPDLPGQLKRMLPWYGALEDIWQPYVHEAVGLQWPPQPQVQEMVKAIDKYAPLIEIELLNGPEYLAGLTQRRAEARDIELGKHAMISARGQWAYVWKGVKGY